MIFAVCSNIKDTQSGKNCRSHLGNEAINLFLKLKNDSIYSKQFYLSKNSSKMEDIETISVLYTALISACSHSCL